MSLSADAHEPSLNADRIIVFPAHRSDLRSYLLDQGIVAPSNTREQLVVLAKQNYKGLSSSLASAPSAASSAWYDSVASVYSAASSYESAARAAATNAASSASSYALTDLYYPVSKSASSASGQASKSASSASKVASKSASSLSVRPPSPRRARA